LIPQHARKIRPPRALSVPFLLGRPLGVPRDEAFQLTVLRAALELLAIDSQEPVFREFEADLPVAETSPDGWSCPVSFAGKGAGTVTAAEIVRQEMSLLRPWYDRSVQEKGGTTVGLSGLPIEEIPAFLARFLVSPGAEKAPADMPLGDALKCAAEDLKAFYNEAATAQPGHATAREIEDWYWNECHAGRMMRDIRDRCADHPDRLVQMVGGFTLVPQSQLRQERRSAP